jgi:hypothetical protein
MRMFWFYITVFGTSLVGIVAVLWIGNHLVAPPAIGGSWSVALTVASTTNRECLEEPGWTNPTTLNVNQSGSFLELSFGNDGHSVIFGRLKDLVITATSPDVANSRDVTSAFGQVTQVLAEVQHSNEASTQLAGVLAIAGCDEPVKFTATNRVPPQSHNSGGGH